MKTYKALIVPTISGGNVEVKVSANSTSQAIGIIKTLPYFKNFVRQPVQEDTKENNLTKVADLVKKANTTSQKK
ncbi:unknown [Clostridium sp. CAG:967]|nr:unknown [Clostridium sp. CAG:967]